MKRRLLNLLTALSLLVCVAAAAMWVRSYFVEDVVSREYARDEGPGVYVTGTTYVASSCGGIALVRGRTVFGGDPARVRDLVDGLRRRHKLASVNGWSRSAPYGYPVGEGSHTLGFARVRDHSDQSLQEPDGTTMRFQAWNRTAAAP